MYYSEGRTMESIAHEYSTSRSTISRWLSEARDRGYVQVTIHETLDSPRQLERRIFAEFGVRSIVVPVPTRATESDALEATAAVAARTLAAEMVPGTILGIAWGSTISAVSRHLPPKRVPETTVVQLNGAGNMHSTGIVYASDILRRFGQAFGAVTEQFPVPTFFDRASTRAAMWEERSIQRITSLQQRMTIALFGIGALDSHVPSHVYVGGYLDSAERDDLRRQGIVGDIATRFFYEDGTHQGIELNDRCSAPDFDDLLTVSTRICVVSSLEKVRGVRAALAGGFVTDLIIDEWAARKLLELGRATPQQRTLESVL